MKPQNSPENFEKCVCEVCPVYTECNRGKADRVFCARTKSDCEMETGKMCFCPVNCPVYSENKLVGAYFCKIELK
jgi:hypothetical protein